MPFWRKSWRATDEVSFSSLIAPAPPRSSTCSDEVRPPYQDQFGEWHRYQEKHTEGDAYRNANSQAGATGKRFRIVDGDGRLIDLVEP